jgi:hypothetical protein
MLTAQYRGHRKGIKASIKPTMPQQLGDRQRQDARQQGLLPSEVDRF